MNLPILSSTEEASAPWSELEQEYLINIYLTKVDKITYSPLLNESELEEAIKKQVLDKLKITDYEVEELNIVKL